MATTTATEKAETIRGDAIEALEKGIAAATAKVESGTLDARKRASEVERIGWMGRAKAVVEGETDAAKFLAYRHAGRIATPLDAIALAEELAGCDL